MTKTAFPATLLCDFYKISHQEQYPQSTQFVYSTWTPRMTRIKGINKVVAFGIQGFIKKYLVNYFQEHFFDRSKEEVIEEYKRVLKYSLWIHNPDTAHIAALHDLGYLPVEIKALKEGLRVPIRVPMLTIENTDPRFAWVTNYLETIMSAEIWQPMTTASIAKRYREILDEAAVKTTGLTEGVDFQGHDFSMRGMSSFESASTSGAGHLLSFTGTDTIPGILYLEEYYNANMENELIGASIPATEHSVQCVNGMDEYKTFKRFLNEVYPSGIFSMVSDTWDFWGVVESVLPKLKEDILNRDGKLIIRPDSGDPVKILCGDPYATTQAEYKGLIECLWETFGGTVTEQGYKLLDSHIGAIYGDSITLERAQQIVDRLAAKGFASTNVVLGIGSYSYQYQTRDTFGFAMKATNAVIDGVEKMIFKDPKTDSGMKKSQRGRVAVLEIDNKIKHVDGLTKAAVDAMEGNLLEPVFKDGKLLRNQSLSEIRSILNSN